MNLVKRSPTGLLKYIYLKLKDAAQWCDGTGENVVSHYDPKDKKKYQ